MPRTIVISGAASGLGLGLLQHYAGHPDHQIIALDLREPTKAVVARPNVEFIRMNLGSTDEVAHLAQKLERRNIDLLIHSAGVRGLNRDARNARPGDIASYESLEAMSIATMQEALNVNAIAAFDLIRSLLPNLCASGGGRVVIMGSRMGSMACNTTGGAYAYRASKAALHAIVKSLSIDVPQVTFVVCHPGRVQTGLVAWKEDGAISVEQSVTDMLSLIDRDDRGDSGRFYDRFGEPIQW